MVYAGYFILFFTAVQFLVALVNLLFQQSFANKEKPANEFLSVLIPARNEEKNIANLLTDLQQQGYKNMEILLFNDQSTDATPAIIKQFAEKHDKIRCFHSNGLPEGWLGKNYACHFLSQKARGNYLLFLDADVRVDKHLLENTLSYAKKYRLGLLSIFPKQVMQSMGEKLTVPNMNYILLSLLPLILVRKSKFPSLSAANGQFMLFHAASYQKIQPHERLKHSMVEDIEIARLYKDRHEQVACLAGSPEITCRMYENFTDAVNGFSKNVIMFFGNSFILALLFWLITTFGFIAVYVSFSTGLFMVYLSALVLTRIMVSAVSRQPVFQNLVLAIPQQVILGILIVKAFRNKFKKQYTWKGRSIS